MASTKSYLDYVLEQISALEGVSFRPMMGEYVIYFNGKVVGGVYDDRFLLKPTKTAVKIMSEYAGSPQMDIPYDGAKEMLVADVHNKEITCRTIEAIAEEIPFPKNNTKH